MGRIEDLGLVADKGLEWKSKCEAITAERDRLRAELEAAKEQARIGVDTWQYAAKQATARADAAEKQRDEARGEAGILREALTLLLADQLATENDDAQINHLVHALAALRQKAASNV